MSDLTDTEIDWYDFGGGCNFVNKGLSNPESKSMVALCQIKKRKFYFRVIELAEETVTEEMLNELMEENKPIFIEQIAALEVR